MAGVLLAVATVFVFAFSDIITKHLVESHPISTVLGIRYTVNLALILAFAGPRLGRRLWRTDRTPMVVGRALVLAMASLSITLAFQRMPVGETLAIVYLAPLLVMLLAIPFLGERITPASWAMAAIGFGGVLLIVRPGAGLDSAGVAFAMLTMVLATAFHLMTKILSRTESSAAMLFHVSWVGTIGFGSYALITHGLVPIPAADLLLMLALGVLATSGHYLFIVAYGLAPASLVAPANYAHILWAALLGWTVFGHLPDLWTGTGMALIAASGTLITLHARFGRHNKVHRMRPPAG